MNIPVKLLERYEKDNPLPIEQIAQRLSEIGALHAIDLDSKARFLKRKSMLAEVAPENFDDAFERYMGNNDLLPINYLQIGYLRSKAIGRVVYFDIDEGKNAVATGFLISPHLMMTNYHVFSDKTKFSNPKIEFNYQFDINGNEATRITFELDPERFFYCNAELDFCLIGVKETDLTGRHNLKERGYLILNGETGKAGIGDYASIIQHPEGDPMQIAIRENKILDDKLPAALIYNTDTAQGSSGSAVFNDQWQLIALHSAGVAKKNAEGKYLDADDKIIEPVNGRIDGKRVVWLSNRGIRVSAIVSHLFSNGQIAGHPLITALSSATYSDGKALAFLALPENEQATLSGSSSAAVSSSSVPVVQPVTINISIGQQRLQVSSDGNAVSTGAAAAGSLSTEFGFEKKFEDEMDYSDCKGFDEYFLGDRTPLPTLSQSLKKKVAFYLDNPNAYVLKYHYYSSVQHAVRRMPVYSAINIWGKRRYSELEGRNDKWFRDNRIDYDAQLNDEYYAYSKMDKGHMVRREDAEYGNSIGFAERAANMTCSYANACPQVPALNRYRFGYYGDWGKLEGKILEEGVKHESGPEAKICVYNGPVFDAEDPVFKSIQVPLRYWKVVVWRSPDQQLHTTCYMLSQEDLVGEVEFEELRFDEIFKTKQVAIKEIEELTGLEFKGIREWDTFQE